MAFFINLLWATLASLAVFAHARKAPVGHIAHEKRDTLHEQVWVKREPIHHALFVPVRVGLTQSNLDKGADMLFDISNPLSPSYGKHLSAQGVTELFSPTQDRVDTVKSWLERSIGHREVILSPSRQWLQFNATIAELQDLLYTEYHEYHHVHSGKAVLGCEHYHIPEGIQDHVDFVVPGVKTLELKKRNHTSRRTAIGRRTERPLQLTKAPKFELQTTGNTSDCDVSITPACIRALYNIHDVHVPHPNNSLGVYENEDQFYNQSDLNKFFRTFTPEIPPGTHPVYNAIDGAPPPGPQFYRGPEADLDYMAAYPLVYGDKVVNYQVDDTYWETEGAGDIVGLFNTFLDAIDKSYCTYSAFGITGDSPPIDPTYPDPNPGGYKHPHQCGVYQPTDVISISWFDQGLVPVNYERRQCHEWMKLGLQGVTVIVASGDHGVAFQGDVCDGNGTVFRTLTPSECPYVTNVGATTLPPGGVAGKTPEIASTHFPTGGGFSNIFPRPNYQASAVESYFENHPPPYPYYNTSYNASHPYGLYNRAGRGYPDLSVVGQSIAIVWEGENYLANGTSASAPFFAGMITRINAARLHAHKKPLGFINPTLYAHPEIFNDVTAGSNPGCGTDGFSAVKGWDPVTGMGTPRYPKLKEVLTSLP